MPNKQHAYYQRAKKFGKRFYEEDQNAGNTGPTLEDIAKAFGMQLRKVGHSARDKDRNKIHALVADQINPELRSFTVEEEGMPAMELIWIRHQRRYAVLQVKSAARWRDSLNRVVTYLQAMIERLGQQLNANDFSRDPPEIYIHAIAAQAAMAAVLPHLQLALDQVRALLHLVEGGIASPATT